MNEKKPPAAAPKSEEPKSADRVKSNLPLLIGILAGVLLFEVVLGVIIVKAASGPKIPADNQAAQMRTESVSGQSEDGADMGQTTADAPIEVVVNIAGTDGDRFLKASVILEYKDRGEKDDGGKEKEASPVAEALHQRMPKYKSYLIDQLSRMTLPELSAPDARDKVRKDLLRMVNSTLPAKLGWVKDAYFTEYIIQ